MALLLITIAYYQKLMYIFVKLWLFLLCFCFIFRPRNSVGLINALISKQSISWLWTGVSKEEPTQAAPGIQPQNFIINSVISEPCSLRIIIYGYPARAGIRHALGVYLETGGPILLRRRRTELLIRAWSLGSTLWWSFCLGSVRLTWYQTYICRFSAYMDNLVNQDMMKHELYVGA